MSILRKNLDAVHIDKFEQLLGKIGLINQFRDGAIKCKFCRVVITQDNIHSIIKEGGGLGYKLVCASACCVDQLNDVLHKRNQKTPR